MQHPETADPQPPFPKPLFFAVVQNLHTSQWGQPPWDVDNRVALSTPMPTGLLYPRTYMLLMYR